MQPANSGAARRPGEPGPGRASGTAQSDHRERRDAAGAMRLRDFFWRARTIVVHRMIQ